MLLFICFIYVLLRGILRLKHNDAIIKMGPGALKCEFHAWNCFTDRCPHRNFIYHKVCLQIKNMRERERKKMVFLWFVNHWRATSHGKNVTNDDGGEVMKLCTIFPAISRKNHFVFDLSLVKKRKQQQLVHVKNSIGLIEQRETSGKKSSK